MAGDLIRAALASILAHPALGHALLALALIGALVPALRAARVSNGPALAAVAVSVFFYGREAAEAELFLVPTVGDPAAFFLSLWPGCWTGGGADLGEWVAPTLVATAFAWLVSARPAARRALREAASVRTPNPG